MQDVYVRASILFQQALELHRHGQLQAAKSHYESALECDPLHFDALHLLGVLLTDMNEVARGIDLIEKALAIHDNHAPAHYNLGNARLKADQLEPALFHFDRAISLRQDYADAFNGRGNALRLLGRKTEALKDIETALSFRPNYAEAASNRGLVLHELGRFEEALTSLDSALSLNANFPSALFNRGNTLLSLKRFEEAAESYQRALELNPAYAEALSNRGNALGELKRHEETIDSYEQALRLQPQLEFLPGIALHTRMKICDWGAANAALEHLIEGVKRREPVSAPFAVLALTDSLELQKLAAQIWVEHKYPSSNELPKLNHYARHQKIRIAYFSSDFHNHPISYLMAELFERHDRSRFEVFAFSFGPDTKEAIRNRLKLAFDQFFDVKDISDREVTELARNHQIDIAIDLNGFTQNSRTAIFAMRAAPIQVNYMGYPGTMGADYIDYILADPTLIPATHQQFYAEKIACLPHTYQVNDSKRHVAEHHYTRSDFSLPENGFVFCSFNNFYKITPAVFDCWMRILHRVESSVLWLPEDNLKGASNLQKEAESRGIDSSRLIFAKRMDVHAEHLARYRLADLFLDTLPYNAHTTASDALWVGLPVLTCLGDSFAARVAGSLLNTIGLPELVTNNLHDYEALAIELAGNPETLAEIRNRLVMNRASSPLFDCPRFARDIEALYSAMYERSQSGQAPIHLMLAKTVGKNIEARLNAAKSLHQLGRLDEAEVGYKSILAETPNHFSALHLLATIALQKRHFAEAADLYQQALAVDSEHVVSLNNRAHALHQIMRSEEALRCYGQALELQPGYVDARYNRGIILRDLKRHDAAIEDFTQVLAQKPDHVGALINMGLALRGLQRFQESIDCYDRAIGIQTQNVDAYTGRGHVYRDLRQFENAQKDFESALALNPEHADLLNNLGTTFVDLENHEQALDCFERAIRLNPDFIEAQLNRGAVLRLEKRYVEALEAFNRVISIHPGHVDALFNRAYVLGQLLRHEEALQSYDLGLAIEPNHPASLNSRGICLRELCRYEEAVASYDRALAINPDYPAALNNRGNALRDLSRDEEALVCYQRALKIDPNFIDAVYNSAYVYLGRGDYPRGWECYESRWKTKGFVLEQPEYARYLPQWTGKEAIAGKSIVVYAEQGFGDFLQFCRYLPMLAEKQAKVFIQVPKPLRRLLASMQGCFHGIAEGEVVPSVDFQSALMSLPGAFGTTLDNIPAGPAYLAAPSDLDNAWSQRLGKRQRLRIGIAFSGNPAHKNDANRSMRLSDMLGALDGDVELVCLQKELRPEDRQTMSGVNNLRFFGEHLSDFADTAALIAQVDLVISVDTSVAHLAGALGKPMWLLLPTNPDWRWLTKRSDSPWYPSAKLYRQTFQGVWSDVIERVKEDLADFIARNPVAG